MPLRLLFCIMLIAMFGAAAQTRKPRTQATVKKEQTQIKQEITQTQREIDENKAVTRRHLNELNSLNSDIAIANASMLELNQEIDRLTQREGLLTDSITQTEKDVERLKKECTKALRDSRRRRLSMSEMNLLFSAESFNQAIRRNRYAGQLNKLAVKKTLELSQKRNLLIQKRQDLVALKERQKAAAESLAATQRQLVAQQARTQVIVNELQRQGASLLQVLNEKKTQVRRLDAELDRIIAEEMRRAEEERKAEERRLAEERRRAEEQRKAEERRRAEEERQKQLAEQKRIQDEQNKAKQKNKGRADKKTKPAEPTKEQTAKPLASNVPKADTKAKTPQPTTAPTIDVAATHKLTGSFSSNRGQLLFPVSVKYRIVSSFGVHQHENLPMVQTENAGIDIEATPGANARAVFDGVVSHIFYIDGFHNVVMVRHGEYVTVYANIDKLAVKKGDAVKCGQQLGHIFSDSSDNDRSVLHFEVRHETRKLNPLEWVKK